MLSQSQASYDPIYPSQGVYSALVLPKIKRFTTNMELKFLPAIEPRILGYQTPMGSDLEKKTIEDQNKARPVKQVLLIFNNKDDRDKTLDYINKIGERVIYIGETNQSREFWGQTKKYPIIELDISFFYCPEVVPQNIKQKTVRFLRMIESPSIDPVVYLKDAKIGEKDLSAQPIDYIQVNFKSEFDLKTFKKMLDKYGLNDLKDCFKEGQALDSHYIRFTPDFFSSIQGKINSINWSVIASICSSFRSSSLAIFLERLSELLDLCQITGTSETTKNIINILMTRDLPNPESLDLVTLSPYLVSAIRHCYTDLPLALTKLFSIHGRLAIEIIKKTIGNLNLTIQSSAKTLLKYREIFKKIDMTEWGRDEFKESYFLRLMHEMNLEEKSGKTEAIKNYKQLSEKEKSYQLFKLYFRLIAVAHMEGSFEEKRIKMNELAKSMFPTTSKINDKDTQAIIDLADQELTTSIIENKPDLTEFRFMPLTGPKVYIPLDRSKKLTVEDIKKAYAQASGDPNEILKYFEKDLTAAVDFKSTDTGWIKTYISDNLPIPTINLDQKLHEYDPQKSGRYIRFAILECWTENALRLRQDLKCLFKSFLKNNSSKDYFTLIRELIENYFPGIHESTHTSFELYKIIILNCYSDLQKFKLDITDQQKFLYPFLSAMCDKDVEKMKAPEKKSDTTRSLTSLTQQERNYSLFKMLIAASTVEGPVIERAKAILAILTNAISDESKFQDPESLLNSIPEIIIFLENLRPDRGDTGGEFIRIMNQWLKSKNKIEQFIAMIYFEYLSNTYQIKGKKTLFEIPIYLKATLDGKKKFVQYLFETSSHYFLNINSGKTIIDSLLIDAKITKDNANKYEEVLLYLVRQGLPASAIFHKDTWPKLIKSNFLEESPCRSLIMNNLTLLLWSAIIYQKNHKSEPTSWAPEIQNAIKTMEDCLIKLQTISLVVDYSLTTTSATFALHILKIMGVYDLIPKAPASGSWSIQPVSKLIDALKEIRDKNTKIDKNCILLSFCITAIESNMQNLEDLVGTCTPFHKPLIDIIKGYTGSSFLALK